MREKTYVFADTQQEHEQGVPAGCVGYLTRLRTFT